MSFVYRNERRPTQSGSAMGIGIFREAKGRRIGEGAIAVAQHHLESCSGIVAVHHCPPITDSQHHPKNGKSGH